ncbi:MAG: cytochrome o ubiquinol oxidase subunit IV [Acetobacter sp.]|jgi:cytochrome o ubiquinol oxidase operon protein cyoD|nr:cytochrome o ubiquinol oxidase subunit IV [Acetobacter sp.]
MSTDHNAHGGSDHGSSYKSYAIGFVLAVILTVAAFMIVSGHSFSPSGTILAISVLAIIQVIVHLHYFLHMSFAAGQKWNNGVFMFTVLFLFIMVVGTLFIMDNTAMHMMSR